MKKVIYTIFIVLWMILIYTLSNQPSYDSTQLSDGFIEKTIGNIYNEFNKDVSEEELTQIKIKYTHPVRKMAHFTIYMILGLLVTLLIKEYNLNSKQIIFLSLLICILYSVSDEIHQLFISGRSGEIRDVLIDTSGSLSGILLINKFLSNNPK